MGLPNSSPITRWLSRTNGFWFTVYAAASAFCLYTCMFAFRKTFVAATFDGMTFLGISYKSWLVISQIIGYGMSKFIGIKVISELKARSRATGVLFIVGIAGLSWLLFGLVAAPYNIIFLFTNGLPLGMGWGMVFGYLEGRRVTEVLGASLSVSFIFSGGLSRAVGTYIKVEWGISEFWMPFAACCLFLLPLLLFLYLLDKLPPPSSLDEQLRTRREPMDRSKRKEFVKAFLPGIILFVLAYMLLTAFRDFRDNYSSNVWQSLGYGSSPKIYLDTEIPISFIVLVVVGSMMLIKNNKTALMLNHVIVMGGMVLIGVSTLLFEQKMIGPEIWMITMGLGLYFGYVPFNSIFFDRLIAAFSYVGTVGFIMYVADSFGYLGSIGILLIKELGLAKLSWLEFFISSGYTFSITGTILITGSMIYFHFRHKKWSSQKQLN